QNDYSRALRAKAPHVSFLEEAHKALRTIATVARAREREEIAATAPRSVERTAAQHVVIERLRARATAEPTPLDEVASKEVLRAYGIAAPDEMVVTSRAEALAAAQRIGYPVVLKAVAAELNHKSDAGAVALDLATPADMAAAYERMTRS